MSRGRANKVTTYKNLPPSIRDKTWIVLTESDPSIQQYLTNFSGKCVVAPNWVSNYSDKFQWLMDQVSQSEKKAVIMDDDLRFATREGDKLLAVATKDQEIKLEDVLMSIEDHLDDVPLVSLHPRQMGHLAPLPYKENGKVICMQGINMETIGNVVVNDYPILADVALNLNVLSRGLGNRLLTEAVLDYGSCQADGGCSLTRTANVQKEAVEHYASLYPHWFKVVKKKPKGENWLADEEGYRYDFRGAWKKLNKDAPNATND